MLFKNKRFFTCVTWLFMILGSLKAQDNVIDLRKANQLLSLAQERDRIASEALEDVKSRRLRMEEDLLDMQDKPKSVSKEAKKKLETDIKTLRKQEEDLLQKRKYANNLLLDVTDILQASPKKRAKFISEFEGRYGVVKLENTVQNQAVTTAMPPSVETDKKAADPITQLEGQAATPPKSLTGSETNAPIKAESKKKKETEKKPKAVAVTEAKPKPEPKKKETEKKPKVEKKTDAVVVTEVKPKPEPKKKEAEKKPKVEKQPDAVVVTEVKPKPEPKKKEAEKKPKVEKKPAVVGATVKRQPDVVVTKPVENQPNTAIDTFQQQSDAIKRMVEKMTEPVTEPVTEPIVEPIVEPIAKPIAETKPKKKKEKEPKQPKITTTTQPKPNIETPSEPLAVVSVPKNESPKKSKDNATKTTKPRNESSKTVAVNYKKYDAKEDVMLITPSNLDCNLAFDGMDNFTGKKKQETSPIILFAHTDDFMRAAMKNKDFVTCEAAATRVEGSRTVYLNLKITVQSKDAQRTFGFLDRGALIIFRFINGRKISLSTNKTDIGVVDVDKGTTTFRAQLAIAETVEFTASELDAIRVSWSIGYEDYEIFDMDVLRNLFKCLDKK